ncbi:MAG: hypothetical protein MUF20_08110 [Methylotetracoccus sp.]|nr:hypothetical protein [Methylotetracoccus sp.]
MMGNAMDEEPDDHDAMIPNRDPTPPRTFGSDFRRMVSTHGKDASPSSESSPRDAAIDESD